MPRPLTTAVTVFIALWCVLVGACLGWQLSYEASPGEVGPVPETCPETLRGLRTPGRALAVLALHPRCPCSAASVAEFERAAARLHGTVDLVVLVTSPTSGDTDWTESPTVARARLIPGTRVNVDYTGSSCDTLGMRTSGHVVAYDAAGCLVFSGGLTPGRGQAGTSASLNTLLGTFAPAPDAAGDAAHAPIFGCRLVAPPAHAPCCAAGAP